MVDLIPVRGLPQIAPDDDLAQLIVDSVSGSPGHFEIGDILVIAQKIVSKAEGRLVRLSEVVPSREAEHLAAETDKDPAVVELVLRESVEVLRHRPGLLVVEDRRGFVCANAGIDRSNIVQHGDGEEVALLPLDPDASAIGIRDRIRALTEMSPAVIINDSHGRAWREGTVGVAIGLAGMPATWDRRGEVDLTGYVLQHTVVGLADEIAAAASLVMGPAAEGIPAVIVRGLEIPDGEGRAKDLQRPKEMDLFR